MRSPPTQKSPSQGEPPRVGRYTFYGEIASGGMASVHLGRMAGQAGFSKTVAIKRPHPHLAKNPEFTRMIVDEARLAARIQHPNVVATLDVVADGGELFLVMDYVHGESLWHLLAAAHARSLRVPPAIIGTIIVNVLHGLHAAHEAVDEQGNPLGIVHRDVSPQNVLVGVDGVARVLDFGVAKATGRLQSTSEGQLKGKFAYMAPEQVTGGAIDRRTDIYAASAVLWGALVGRRLIEGKSEAELLNKVLAAQHPPPSTLTPQITEQMDAVVMRGLSREPHQRFETARDMALAVEAAFGVVSPFQVGEWVKSLAAEAIALRASRIREMESSSEVRISMHQGVAEIVSGHSETFAAAPATQRLEPHAPPMPVASYPPHTAGPYGLTTPGMYVSAGAAPVEPPRSSLVSLIGVAAIVFSLTFGGALYYGMRHRLEVAPSPAATSPAATEPAPAVEVSATAAAPSTPRVAPLGAPNTEPSQVAQAPSAASATSTAAPPSPPRTNESKSNESKSSESKSKPKPKSKKDCEVSPFYVDSDGIKQVRPECM